MVVRTEFEKRVARITMRALFALGAFSIIFNIGAAWMTDVQAAAAAGALMSFALGFFWGRDAERVRELDKLRRDVDGFAEQLEQARIRLRVMEQTAPLNFHGQQPPSPVPK